MAEEKTKGPKITRRQIGPKPMPETVRFYGSNAARERRPSAREAREAREAEIVESLGESEARRLGLIAL